MAKPIFALAYMILKFQFFLLLYHVICLTNIGDSILSACRFNRPSLLKCIHPGGGIRFIHLMGNCGKNVIHNEKHFEKKGCWLVLYFASLQQISFESPPSENVWIRSWHVFHVSVNISSSDRGEEQTSWWTIIDNLWDAMFCETKSKMTKTLHGMFTWIPTCHIGRCGHHWHQHIIKL